MLTVIQWAGGIGLGIIALSILIVFSASVVAILEQETTGTRVVACAVSFVLFLVLLATAYGAWALVTAALGW